MGRWSYVWAALTLAGLAMGPSRATKLPPVPVHANGQVLWRIVDGQCVPNQRAHGSPQPCAQVDVGEGRKRGYAVLKDKVGVGQYLVMPTVRISGIEDHRLTAPGAPDYFTPAWHARALVQRHLATVLRREDVGISVNSIYGRSQDLLHLHVDCLRPKVRDLIARELPNVGYRWSGRGLMLEGHAYRYVRIDGDDDVAANPFLILKRGLHVPSFEMKAWTLVLAGAYFPDGRPGFVLLAARVDPAEGYDASGERLQDHSCALH